MRLLAGDDAGYRDLCAAIVRDADEIGDPFAANVLSRACSYSAAAPIDRAVPLRLAQQSVAGPSYNMPWYFYGLGAAHYRAGQYEEAIARLEESRKLQPNRLCGETHAVLALACQRLGQHDDARAWLAKAKSSLAEMEQTIGREKYGFAGSSYLGPWLATLVLLSEAEKIVMETENP